MPQTDTSEFVYRPANGKPSGDTSLTSSKSVFQKIAQCQRDKIAQVPSIVDALPVCQPTALEQDAFNSLQTAQNGDSGETVSLQGVELADRLRARAGCLVALLGGLASGNTWGTCSERSGLSYIQASIIAQWDRQGFGKLLKLAEECQKRAFVVQMRGALHHRAVEGVRSARIGRIGKDQDGILRDDQGKIIEEVKYSDKLLEFGLSKLDKPTFGEQGANVHIGAQVIYNISGLGVTPKPAIDAEIVDAKPEAGENPATIDMRSLEDVD